MIDPELLKILVCPLGKAPLRLQESSLVCTQCGLSYKVENDIPIMLIEEAQLPKGVNNIHDLACHPAHMQG